MEVKNKSEFVRGLLKEMGALTENPPKGWRQAIEGALQAHNLKMNQVYIYQLRRREMDKLAGEKKEPAKKATKKSARKQPATRNELGIEDLVKAKNFISEFGGLKRFAKAYEALAALGLN
jgi:hypothetical protein